MARYVSRERETGERQLDCFFINMVVGMHPLLFKMRFCTIQGPLYKATEKTANLRFSEMVRISCMPTTPDSNPFSLQPKKEDSLYRIRWLYNLFAETESRDKILSKVKFKWDAPGYRWRVLQIHIFNNSNLVKPCTLGCLLSTASTCCQGQPFCLGPLMDLPRWACLCPGFQ